MAECTCGGKMWCEACQDAMVATFPSRPHEPGPRERAYLDGLRGVTFIDEYQARRARTPPVAGCDVNCTPKAGGIITMLCTPDGVTSW